jgi:hypothetical protein
MQGATTLLPHIVHPRPGSRAKIRRPISPALRGEASRFLSERERHQWVAGFRLPCPWQLIGDMNQPTGLPGAGSPEQFS